MADWKTTDIPSQEGCLAVVTGANSGIGYNTALELARAGAEVIVAGRSEAKGNEAVRRIQAELMASKVRFGRCDLASLQSIAIFSANLIAAGRPLDLLINNAGVMALPAHTATSDGFEMQFGTNHLGHFALTGQVLPLLLQAERPRVVNVSSLAHRQGKIDFEDLQAQRSYKPWAAYCQSKLANLLFTFELQRRSDTKGWWLKSEAAHPGWARTELIANGPGSRSLPALLGDIFAPLFSHSAAGGADPTLFAATSPDAKPAGYYGPGGFQELKGAVAPACISPKATNAGVARRLWEVSEDLTGLHWA